MNIVFDFRPALSRSTGVGTYVRNLVAALGETFPNDTYTVFSASWRERLDPSLVPEPVRVADWKIPVRALDFSWHRWRFPPVETFVGPVDVAHSPSPMLLPSRAARTVVTVHDCHFMRHPEDVFGPVRRDYVPLARRAAAQADAVVVNSQTTASEVEEILGIPRDKICVTPLGVSRRFFEPPGVDEGNVLGKLGLDRPFILFVGRREKRKDLGTLLAAFDEILETDDDVVLALTGSDAPGWKETWEAASERVRRRTRLFPHQEPEHLVALYRAASLLVMPSRWEGFGLTGLESMAAGTPVVASEVGALPEILGDAAAFAPAGDVAGMAHQCRLLLQDDELAETFRRRGRERAAAFPWTDTARRTHDLYVRLGAT
jgi:glycosyltransferase involved in cell wall biosynthesis